MQKSKLIVDHREREVINRLVSNKFQAEYRQLECGDFIITKNDIPQIIIERKTIRDYADSMYDGRINNYFKLLEYSRKYNCKVALRNY